MILDSTAIALLHRDNGFNCYPLWQERSSHKNSCSVLVCKCSRHTKNISA